MLYWHMARQPKLATPDAAYDVVRFATHRWREWCCLGNTCTTSQLRTGQARSSRSQDSSVVLYRQAQCSCCLQTHAPTCAKLTVWIATELSGPVLMQTVMQFHHFVSWLICDCWCQWRIPYKLRCNTGSIFIVSLKTVAVNRRKIA